jgi:hypothetical protein
MSNLAAPGRRPIGTWRGVDFDVIAWDAVGAETDLSVACMFHREVGGAAMAGGLAHLDRALGGALSALRATGEFQGDEMDTLNISSPPEGFHATSVLIVGLGDVETMSASRMERAVRTAAREALRSGAVSVAFAPSLLDAGLTSGVTTGVAAAMLRGVAGALLSEWAVAARGLAGPPALRRWAFDAGASHLDSVAAEFSAAFRGLPTSAG